MILVTGATGNIGRSLLTELLASDAGPVRALTRHVPGPALPRGIDTVHGDLADIASLESALNGVRSIFLLPGLGSDAEILGAARRAGVEHVVLVSSITVRTHPHLAPAAEKAAVEKLLESSGLEWTILRPTQFASNALMWATEIAARQPVRLPYADTALPTIHPADIASVARVALTGPGHRGQRYTLTGPARISAREQIETIAEVLNRDIEIVEITRAQARAAMVQVVGDDEADAVLDVTGGDVNDELLRVDETVSQVTGVSARPFRKWVEENLDAFR